MQYVIDGQGNLFCHLLHEAQLGILINSPMFASETNGSEPTQRCSDGNRTK
jgi:hypothetical protein